MRRSKPWLVYGLILSSGLIVAVILWPTLHRQLDAWHLLPRTEAYTELYFDPQFGLPAGYTPGQTWPLSFVISNHESSGITYSYKIMIYSRQSPVELATGQVNLATKQSRQVNHLLRLPAQTDVLRLVVELSYDVQRPHLDKPLPQKQHLRHQLSPVIIP